MPTPKRSSPPPPPPQRSKVKIIRNVSGVTQADRADHKHEMPFCSKIHLLAGKALIDVILFLNTQLNLYQGKSGKIDVGKVVHATLNFAR